MRQLTYLLIAAVGLSLAASCALNQLEEPVQSGQEIVFTATAAQSGTPFSNWANLRNIEVAVPAELKDYYQSNSPWSQYTITEI